MNTDELISLEPPAVPEAEAVGSDHHSKAVAVEEVDDGAAMADVALEALGRRRVRSNRLNSDKTEPAMVLPSFIWDYFVKDASGKFVICTLCPAQTTRFAYSGGTSTMNRHLRKKHQKYAPGKCAADYEYPRGTHRRLQAVTSPPPASTAVSTLIPSDTGIIGSLSPGEPMGKQRHQLLELRTARRRAASGSAAKRRKLLAEQTETTNTLTVAGTEFDPAGFVTLPGSTTTNTSGALQFPAGFELSDAGIEMAGVGLDQRFFDYSTLSGASTTGRGRRHSSSISGNSSGVSSVNSAANQKILTHRLLKYLIAQYEPLDVSHMGAELSMLLFGGSTEWPTPGLNFGYGFGGGMGGNVPKLPSEDTIKLALANLYYSQREILKEVMADVEVLSLSLNNWTSAFGQNVLTVSGHWISRGFRRRDCVLEVYVLPLDERVNTIALLRDVMDKWEIPSAKVAALTMRPHTPTTSTVQEEEGDSSQTVAQAQAEAEAEATTIHSEYPGLAVVRCFAEELEGAVAGGLRECADLTRRCRNYVSYFIQNPSEYQIFLALQRSMGEEASAASASAQTASIVATADGVSVSIAEGGNATLGDELDGNKEGQNTDTTADDGGSQSENASTIPPTSGSNPCSGEALPVICDFDDRWNSTTQMMCRIVELELMLLQYKTGLESDTNPARRPMQLRFVCCELSPEEWASLKQLARLLEPIEGLVHVSPLAYPGLSIVYPLLHSLKKHLADAGTWVTDPLVASVRHTIVNNLNMDLCSSGDAPSSPYLACLLDPRFKSLPFLEAVEKERLVESLYLLLGVNDKDDSVDVQHHDPVTGENSTEEQKKLDQSTKTPVASASLANKKTAALLHEFFPLDEPATELDKLKTQVQQYLDSPSLPATDETEHDPLEWWSRYQRLFPSLARLAKKYLCISAVSTPFQEAFTNYGQLMREKKARLDIEVAAQVLFCRSVSRIPEMERIGV
ncbi:Zinc finger BED domain-containing protein 1 [Phytophthora citrophthora]|uniref:Zinc finger BED domain-containing protein 1 n=1 Tax=Phytophthora citrophthora TaxID=4793 RepID=A0AAD9LH50_9STRA|nr:Zinc finger BED domain-containing protein 1 [Phytophthora citrophthora]